MYKGMYARSGVVLDYRRIPIKYKYILEHPIKVTPHNIINECSMRVVGVWVCVWRYRRSGGVGGWVR